MTAAAAAAAAAAKDPSRSWKEQQCTDLHAAADGRPCSVWDTAATNPAGDPYRGAAAFGTGRHDKAACAAYQQGPLTGQHDRLAEGQSHTTTSCHPSPSQHTHAHRSHHTHPHRRRGSLEPAAANHTHSGTGILPLHSLQQHTSSHCTRSAHQQPLHQPLHSAHQQPLHQPMHSAHQQPLHQPLNSAHQQPLHQPLHSLHQHTISQPTAVNHAQLFCDEGLHLQGHPGIGLPSLQQLQQLEQEQEQQREQGGVHSSTSQEEWYDAEEGEEEEEY